MIIAICIILAFIVIYKLFMWQPQFGRLPTGDRLEQMKMQPTYKGNAFENLHDTPQLTDGANFFSIMKTFFFHQPKRGKPAQPLPAQKVDLKALPHGKNVPVWFGHSSYFLQVDGRKFLVDPVFSGSASPLRFTTKSFPGSDVYSADDMPEIDYLIITHDHYDHMDYGTIVGLKSKIKHVITSLGVGAHLEHWGYAKHKIIEKYWHEEADLGGGFKINTTPARHFSGRTFKRNQSLWQSFVLTTPTKRLFLGGDSGYDDHFAQIGTAFGPFDLVILECGQYNKFWKHIHMLPPEVVQAAHDLNAKWLLPVHWGKFALSLHDWDEPVNRVTQIAAGQGMPTVTPMIGEELDLDDLHEMARWWEGLE